MVCGGTNQQTVTIKQFSGISNLDTVNIRVEKRPISTISPRYKIISAVKSNNRVIMIRPISSNSDPFCIQHDALLSNTSTIYVSVNITG